MGRFAGMALPPGRPGGKRRWLRRGALWVYMTQKAPCARRSARQWRWLDGPVSISRATVCSRCALSRQARRVPDRLLAAILGLAAPPHCCCCRSPARGVLCDRCEAKLESGVGQRLRIAGVDRAWAARPYQGVARDLVTAVKFRQLLSVSGRGAELIAAEAPQGLLDGPLVPVPADPLRRAWRGYDPAELLAAELARCAGLPLLRCLSRKRGPRQVGRSRDQRLASPPLVRVTTSVPERVVLVDDVSTTGATLAACASTLRGVGCREVKAVVLAAAPA